MSIHMQAHSYSDILVLCPQAVAKPFRFAAEVEQTLPQSTLLKTSTQITVRAMRLALRPSFGHVPLIHAAQRIMEAAKAQVWHLVAWRLSACDFSRQGPTRCTADWRLARCNCDEVKASSLIM